MADDAQAASGRPLGAISTLVSLFLLLLVFFIVLFSIAEIHHQRVQEVVTSIDRAFGGWPTRLGIVQKDEWTPVPGREALVRDVTGLLKGFGALDPAAGGGAVAELTLDTGAMFDDGPALKPAALAALKPLVVRLASGLGEGGRVELTLRAGGEDGALVRSRLAALAAALYTSGWPAESLRVEVSGEGKAGLVLRVDGVVP